jgi:hypothetical protein
MRLLNRLADAALSRVLPTATAEAAWDYRCNRSLSCPQSPSFWANQRRECSGGTCGDWETFQCCV